MNSCMWAAVHLSEDEDKLRHALIIILESAKNPNCLRNGGRADPQPQNTVTTKFMACLGIWIGQMVSGENIRYSMDECLNK